MRRETKARHRQRVSGFTLVELLMTMALLGAMMLSITNLLVKGTAMSSSIDYRYQEAIEVQAFVLDLMKELSQGVYISSNSHKQRLEYTTYNASGSATKKVYAICYSTASAASTDTACAVNSGSNTIPYLKLSTDGGSTWGSPYRLSAFNKYRLSGTPLFLYAQEANNCTSFTDTDANGVWLSGTDAAGAFADCGSYDTSSPILTSPTQATKVVLNGFSFTTGKGVPEATRSLPSNIFMTAPQGLVASYSSAVSPGVKDNILVKSFDTSTANSLFGAGYQLWAVTWDPVRQRLLSTGYLGSGSWPTKLFQIDRTGVLIGQPLYIPANPYWEPTAVALLDDGETVMVVNDDGTNSREVVCWYNLNTNGALAPSRILNLSNPSDNTTPGVSSLPVISGASTDLVNYPNGIVYDPKYPDEIFVLGNDPTGGAFKIFEINTRTGALASNVLSGGKLTLTGTKPVGLAQEPTTGDFLYTDATISGSAPNRTIKIYRITSGGTTSYITVNIDDLGSTAATGPAGWFSLAYDPDTNHIFLSDAATGKMFEILPDRLISPRQ